MLRAYIHGWRQITSKLESLPNDPQGISDVLVDALIAAEDHRYWSHNGVDLAALIRASWRTMNGRREGGSTIAMQLVRVLTGRYERSIARKLVEIFLAQRLTRLLGRKSLPLVYLKVAYFGWRMNGIEQARARIGLEDLKDLSHTEAANLVARLKYPEPKKLSDVRHRQILKRTEYILRKQKLPRSMHYGTI